MGETRNRDDKFKATFGYITDHAITARKDEVRKKLADIATDVGNLPGSTPAASKKIHQDAVDGLKSEVQEALLGGKEKKEAYKICETVDKRADKIKKAVDALAESEKQLPALKGMQPDEIDKMVKKIGDKAKSAKDQGFMIAAIRARYDLDEMSGQLTSAALPRFYKVLGMVPEEHARLNDSLKRIHRDKKDGTSTAAAGQMTINAGLAKGDNTTGKFNDSEGKKLKLNDFDATTLHEIGHTVDEAYDFMTSKREDVNFGGWKESSFDEVAGLIAAELKKSLKDEGLTDDQLKWLAESGLRGTGVSGIDLLLQKADADKVQCEGADSKGKKNWLKDKAIAKAEREVKAFLKTHKATLDQGDKISNDVINKWIADTKPDTIKALSPHKTDTPEGRFVGKVITAMMAPYRQPQSAELLIEQWQSDLESAKRAPSKAVVDKVKSNVWLVRAAQMGNSFWEKSQTDIAAAAIDGKVYQFNQAKWWRYELKARDNRVSDYQFRSPLEWFAEVYAVFQLGKLNKGHPCYKLIDNIKTKQTA